jgi:predicted RNase H-like HicB family nuclease
VVFKSDEDRRILAICPALHGCYGKGETEEQARGNIREAIEAHTESRRRHGEAIPEEVGVDKVAVVL